MFTDLVTGIYKYLMPLRDKITSSNAAIKLFFRLDLPKETFVDQVDFDQSTLTMKYAMRNEIFANAKVFEMGIGAAGLLSICDAKRRNTLACGADIQKIRVKQSKLVAAEN